MALNYNHQLVQGCEQLSKAFKNSLSWAAEKEKRTYPFNISDGTHWAGILEIISKHGNEVVGNASNSL